MKKVLTAILCFIMTFQTGAFAKMLSDEDFNKSKLDDEWSIGSDMSVSYTEAAASGGETSKDKCSKLSEGQLAVYGNASGYNDSTLFQIGFDAMMTGAVKVLPYGYTAGGAVAPTVDYEWGTGTSSNGVLIESGKWYSYRFDIDLTAGVWKLYVDDRLFITGGTNGVKNNDNFNIFVRNADLYIDNFYMDGSKERWAPDADNGEVIFDTGTEIIVSKPGNAVQNKVAKFEQSGGASGMMGYYFDGNKQDSGVVTLEYKFLVMAGEMNTGIEMRWINAGGSAIEANIQGDNVINFNGTTVAYKLGEWTSVKIVADLDNGTYDAYVNDTLAAENCSENGDFQAMIIVMYQNNVFYLDDYKMSNQNGVIRAEAFEGSALDGNCWAGNGILGTIVENPLTESERAMTLTAKSANYETAKATRSFESVYEDNLVIEFDVKADSIANPAYIKFGQFDMVFTNGGVFTSGDGFLGRYDTEWHKYKLIFNPARMMVNAYMDGTLYLDSLVYADAAAPINSMSIQLNNSKMSIDNLKINVYPEGDITAHKIIFRDENGNEIDRKITQNSLSGITADIEIKNTALFSGNTYTAAIAFFKDGTLKGINPYSGELNAQEEKKFTTELLNADTAEDADYQAKVFVWRSVDNMTPVLRAHSVTPDCEEVWICPHPWDTTEGVYKTLSHYNTYITDPASWSEVYEQTDVVKFYMNMLNPAWGIDLAKLVDITKDKKVAFEVGGMRSADIDSYGSRTGAAAAEFEINELLTRWKDLGGRIDYITTDHAITLTTAASYSPERYEAVVEEEMKYFEKIHEWNPDIKFGIIESLGYFRMQIDGTVYNPTGDVKMGDSDDTFDEFLDMIQNAADRYGITIDHFDIDFGYDTSIFDNWVHNRLRTPDYSRIRAALQRVRQRGLKAGVIFNTYYQTIDQQHSSGKYGFLGVEKTDRETHDDWVTFYKDFIAEGGAPDKMIIQSWSYYPTMTGPETADYSFFNNARDMLRVR